MISFEDFKKIELKTAKIIEAKEVEGSEKIVQLKVQIGEEERQILAGIKKNYSLESLIGKTIIVVTNLAPKNLMGLESNGMLLAASLNGEPVLLTTEKEVEPGCEVR